jgi:hypothetical protein
VNVRLSPWKSVSGPAPLMARAYVPMLAVSGTCPESGSIGTVSGGFIPVRTSTVRAPWCVTLPRTSVACTVIVRARPGGTRMVPDAVPFVALRL